MYVNENNPDREERKKVDNNSIKEPIEVKENEETRTEEAYEVIKKILHTLKMTKTRHLRHGKILNQISRKKEEGLRGLNLASISQRLKS